MQKNKKHGKKPLGVHGGVTLFVVGRVDEDLVEDVVEARDEGDGSVGYPAIFVDPEGLGVLLDGTDEGVGTEEDVIDQGILLVGFCGHGG